MTRDKGRQSPAKRPRAGRASDAAATDERLLTTGAAPPPQRIAKVIARAGLCSRRDAEAWIVEGRVAVNGVVLTSPAMDVGPDDAIVVDDEPLPAAEKTRLFLFHKPRGLVTSDHDPEGRETVAGYLREHWPEGPRVVTIGRLDINTEGLLLLTNDGGLARLLELPKTGWIRRYRVRAKGETDQGALDTLRDGVTLDGIDYAGIEATLDRVQGANCWMTLGLREGKNREVKRVLEHLGLEVNRLIRLSFGPFQLLDLAEGRVEEVKTRILRDQLGERIAAEAGVTFDLEALPQQEPSRGATLQPTGTDARQGSAVGAQRRTMGSARGGRTPDRDRSDRAGRDATVEPDQKRRERPIAGTRKHVSALRAEEAEAEGGARRRVERSSVKDRRDRTVTVERVVSTRADAASRPARRTSDRKVPDRQIPERQVSDRQAPDRQASGRGSSDRGFSDRGATERRSAVRGSSAGAGHASPSALAKRQRVAKSAGPRIERDGEAPTRGKREEGRDERRPAHGTARRDAAARSGMRSDAGERRERSPQGSRRPAEGGETGKRPADKRQTRGELSQGGRSERTGRGDSRDRTSGPGQGRTAGREAGDQRRSGKPQGDRPRTFRSDKPPAGKARADKPRSDKGGSTGGRTSRPGKDAARPASTSTRINRPDRAGAAPSRARPRSSTPPKGSGSPRRK